MADTTLAETAGLLRDLLLKMDACIDVIAEGT